MSRRTRRNHSPTFKAQVAIAAIGGDKTLAQLAEQFDLHPNQILDWKKQLQQNASEVFGSSTKKTEPTDLKPLHESGIDERKTMINRNHKISITRQAQLLGFSRGTVYYKPKAISETTLAIMHAIDRLHMDCPFMGARMLRDHLERQGHTVGRKLGRVNTISSIQQS